MLSSGSGASNSSTGKRWLPETAGFEIQTLRIDNREDVPPAQDHNFDDELTSKSEDCGHTGFEHRHRAKWLLRLQVRKLK